MEIFKLVGSIFVDSKDAENSISKTGEKAEGLGKKLAGGIKTAGKWAAGLTGAAVAVGGAMLAAAKDTASNLDVVDKASIRMGISAERYQELAYAAGLCGVEMSTMEAAAKKLEGTDINMDDALASIMAIEDESERTAAAIDLFGESVAYKMAPLLQAGADGLQDMTDEARQLGLVMSNDTVKAGAETNDMFSKVSQSMSALKTGLVTQLMPYVVMFLQMIIDNMPKIQAAVSKVLDIIVPLVQGVFALLSGDTEGFIEGIKTFFTNLVPTMVQLGKNILNGLWEGFKAVWGGIKDWFSGIGDSIAGFFGFGGTPDGSHAAGLPYVPYDGYRAELHRGETVLNAADTSQLTALLRSGGAADVAPINITVPIMLSGRKIAEEVVQINDRGERARGW